MQSELLKTKQPSVPIPCLQRVLSYQNLRIEEKFSEVYGVSPDDAKWIFNETKKLLWLLSVVKLRDGDSSEYTPFEIYRPLVALDEMWHTFILFTLDYASFCDDFLGEFIHHVPNTRSDRQNRAAKLIQDPEGCRNEEKLLIENQCRLIARELGQETLQIWFKDIPAHFSDNPRFAFAI